MIISKEFESIQELINEEEELDRRLTEIRKQLGIELIKPLK